MGQRIKCLVTDAVYLLSFSFEDKGRWRSIYIVYSTILIGGCAYSLSIPALWPFLREVGDEKWDF